MSSRCHARILEMHKSTSMIRVSSHTAANKDGKVQADSDVDLDCQMQRQGISLHVYR